MCIFSWNIVVCCQIIIITLCAVLIQCVGLLCCRSGEPVHSLGWEGHYVDWHNNMIANYLMCRWHGAFIILCFDISHSLDIESYKRKYVTISREANANMYLQSSDHVIPFLCNIQIIISIIVFFLRGLQMCPNNAVEEGTRHLF